MDPDALLREIGELRELAAQGVDVRRNERELRWKITDLFEWLAKGGFPPDWTRWINTMDRYANDDVTHDQCDVESRDPDMIYCHDHQTIV